jgi:pimeloyl-ACP methyl ester carboxylesterase
MLGKSPTIKFLTKKNGERVAYALHGSGPYLVVPAWWVSHLELDWEQPSYQAFFNHLGQFFTVLRYDRPGSGLSDRERRGFALEDEVESLSCLVDHLAIKRFDILAISCAGPPSLLYTYTNSERVQNLMFIGAYADGGDISVPAVQEALSNLVAANWGMGAKAILDLFDADMEASGRKQLGRVHRESASPEMAAALLKLSFGMNAKPVAPKIDNPALVIHCSKDKTVPFDAGRKLASLLPNSELVRVSGHAHLPWMGDQAGRILSEIKRFTGLENGEQDSAGSLRTSTETEKIAGTDTEQESPHESEFRHEGDVWVVAYSAQRVHLKDARGLHDIAMLLRHAGQDISVERLTGQQEDVVSESNAPILDAQAVASYRERLADIAEAKESAGAEGNEVAYEALDNEEEAIIRVLGQGLGLAGRPRLFNHQTERARKAVAARIKSAIKKIQAQHPALGEHLEQSLNTGRCCSYRPQNRIIWRT